jgi:DNA invertase Pin-like site-specific DNA recombinase
MEVGYARVSTAVQNLDLQLDALRNHGCEEIFTDKISGTKDKRPGLEEILRFVRPGNTLVVWRLDRLGRNMQDLIRIVNELNDREISFHSLQENITMDKSSATGQLMFHLFAAFAEFERNLIQERSAVGRMAARARGRLGGKPEKLEKKDIDLIKSLVAQGTPIKDIAQMWGLSRTTVYRNLEK